MAAPSIAVHFGAGNIGRGLIGDLLHRSGYRIVFVDVDSAAVAELTSRGAYDLFLLDHDYEHVAIDDVSALSSLTEDDAVIEAIVEAELITTSVWANNLAKIAPVLARGLRARAERGRPRVNVLACENAIFASATLRTEIIATQTLPASDLDRTAAFPNTAVDRVVLSGEHGGVRGVEVADYFELPIERPALADPALEPIQGATYTDDLRRYIERKLYVINCGHAWAGYLGYVLGYDSVRDVFTDPVLVARVEAAMRESAALIAAKHGFSAQEMDDYVRFGVSRYQAKGVEYPVSMVTRAPIRKLGPDERLVAPYRQCAARGLKNEALAEGIALVLLLDRTDDPQAVELQTAISDLGVTGALARYSGLPEWDPLQGPILRHYDEQRAIRDARRRTRALSSTGN